MGKREIFQRLQYGAAAKLPQAAAQPHSAGIELSSQPIALLGGRVTAFIFTKPVSGGD